MDFDTYSAAKDSLPFLLGAIQTHQLAPTGDLLVNANFAVQSYHTMKQLFDDNTNKYRIRMEDKVGIFLGLSLDVPSQQKQAMRSLSPFNPVTHAYMIAGLRMIH